MADPVQIVALTPIHIIPADESKPEGWKVTDKAGGKDLGIQFVCTTSASSYSYVDPMNTATCIDYVLLRHDIEFIPTGENRVDSPWEEYFIGVRALNAAGSGAIQEGDTNVFDSPLVIPWFSGNVRITADDGQVFNVTLPVENFYNDTGALCLPGSQPGNMPQLVNSSTGTSVSQTVGASVGFFGADLTGSVSASETTTMSTNLSYSTPTIASQDLGTDSHILLKEFKMNPITDGDITNPAHNPGAFSFSVAVAEVFSVPDDMHGLRDGKTTARHFEVNLVAKKNLTWDTPTRTNLITGTTDAVHWEWLDPTNPEPSGAIFRCNVRHVIRVPAPPLPFGVKGLDFPNEYNDPNRKPSAKTVTA